MAVATYSNSADDLSPMSMDVALSSALSIETDELDANGHAGVKVVVGAAL